MSKELYFTSWQDMERQARDLIKFLKQRGIKRIAIKKREFESGNLDNKYRIWIELKVAEHLLLQGHSLEILKEKNPDIKIDTDTYIEIKSFDKENFEEQKLIVNLIKYLNENFPQWKNLNFQIFIKYRVGSQSKVNEQRKINIPLLSDESIQTRLYQDVVVALKKKSESDKHPEFYIYKFDIVSFNNPIDSHRKFFIHSSYSGDSENWLLNKITILAEKSKSKFSPRGFNILFVYYPFIERDFIDKNEWQNIELNIWKDSDIRKVYSAIIMSDFDKFFRTTQNANGEKIIKSLFKQDTKMYP